MRSMTSIVAAGCLFVACQGAMGQLVPTLSNVQYGDGHPRQVLDLYLPAGGGAPRALVVWIHGGGWVSGDKFPAAKASPLLAAGFAVASVNYRLSGDAVWPAQGHDCKAAIRWLRANADSFNIDGRRIGVWGSSAGGHLSSWIGTSGGVASIEGNVGAFDTVSSRVQACADYFGPTDFLSIPATDAHAACTSPESEMLGVCLRDLQANLTNPAWADELAIVNSASSTTHVSPDDPPFHIAHGTADPVVDPEHSQILFDRLRAAGVPATLRYVTGAGHGLPNTEDPFVIAFFRTHLGAHCIADFDGSGGTPDANDIDEFFLAWLVGDPSADADDSGGTPDASDVEVFFEAWLSGGCL